MLFAISQLMESNYSIEDPADPDYIGAEAGANG
jgi:hypothetical protein